MIYLTYKIAIPRGIQIPLKGKYIGGFKLLKISNLMVDSQEDLPVSKTAFSLIAMER